MGGRRQGGGLLLIAEGIRAMRDGLIAWKDMGFQYDLLRYLSMLASAYYKAGEAEEGLRVIGEALSAIESTSERCFEPEVLRLKGELLLVRSPPNIGEAEDNFLRAIDVARNQSAKTWELRAATSLARLWRHMGQLAEARDLLAPIYGWFTEGFDTPDLKDARALLDKVNAAIGNHAE
jgi:predicted ATPase